MFDSGWELPAVGTAQLAGLIEQNHAELMARGVSDVAAGLRLGRRALPGLGQQGLPAVDPAGVWGGEDAENVGAAAVPGALQGTGMMAARALIADALDLRYRLRGYGVEC